MKALSVLEIIGLITLVLAPVTIGVCLRFNHDSATENIVNPKTNSLHEVNIMPATTNEGNVSGNGTIVYLSFEGGFYGIISDDGKRYDALNLDPAFQINGLRVRFVAQILHVATFHMWGTPVSIIEIERLDKTNTDIPPDAQNLTGNLSKLTTPYNNSIDGDWNTKITWDTGQLGDFSISIMQNYSVQVAPTNVFMEFKAHHYRHGSLMPTPMSIQFWNGSTWKTMYELDDEQHVNETFTEKVNVPNDAFVNDKITIKTTIRYSSHVAGGILPYGPMRLLHYAEYYEGKLTTNNNSGNLNGLPLIAITAAIATAVVGGTLFAVLRRNRQTPS